ncbi:MAG: GDP-mannose 4,6-dehydratase [Sulfuricaulis sp.]
MKRALICGISGQDGTYLAKFLLDKGYEVCGASRDASVAGFHNLDRVGIRRRVRLESMALNDFRSVLQVLTKIQPNEIYNLAGQSSVGLSFEQPVETLESIAVGTLNLLEVMRFQSLSTKLYNAGSSECFGDVGDIPADETTPFRPRSPYAVAKSTAFWEVANYREAYGLFGCSGILFNHESPLRPERFVTKKIVATACRIARGSGEKLRLGNISIARDWGWAPEYVEAMWKMLQHSEPEDFVIATGETHRLHEFIAVVFSCLGLDWQHHVETDPYLFRPTDLAIGKANPSKASDKLQWIAKYRMADVARLMVEAELAKADVRDHGVSQPISEEQAQ